MTTTARRPDAGFFRSAGTISALTAVSRVTGVLRESVLSWLLGAGAAFDAYSVGYRVANLGRDLFAEGSLSSAFVPTFTRYLTTRSDDEARRLSNITGTVLMAVVGAVCALGMLASRGIVELFAPGFHAVPGKFDLAVRMVRTMFPFLLLVSLAAQAQGILFANRRFGMATLSSSLFNIGSVTFGVSAGYWLGPRFGIDAVDGMAYGVLFGGAAQLAVQLPSVWKAGFAWRPAWDLAHEGVRQIFRLMGPAVVGGIAGQVNLLISTNIAAALRDSSGHPMNGPVSWLAYAYRFLYLPMGLFGISIATATLPRISSDAARSDIESFRATLSRSILTLLLFTIPSAAGLILLGRDMIGIVYEHGKFLAADTERTALALACYAVGLAGYAATKVLAPAFYALGDARTPMIVSLVSVPVNVVSALVLVRYSGLGYAGLALALSCASSCSAVLLLGLMRTRLGRIGGHAMAASTAKILIATAAMAAAVWGVKSLVHVRAWTVAIGVPLGSLVYYAVANTLNIPEFAEARSLLKRR